MKTYQYLKDYLPVRYQANAQQLADRQTCYNFKNGNLNDEIKSGFLNKIQEITNGEKTSWCICFIPASTKSKTQTRYKKLAEAIQTAGYKVAINAIYNEHDHEAGHLTGKTGNPIEGFGFNTSEIAGKKIIVIDDIITRGRTFQMVAEKLEIMGAASVTGVFLAKTFNQITILIMIRRTITIHQITTRRKMTTRRKTTTIHQITTRRKRHTTTTTVHMPKT